MMKRYSLGQRRFAARMVRRAARLAERSGDVQSNQVILWRLMVEASHKPASK